MGEETKLKACLADAGRCIDFSFQYFNFVLNAIRTL